MKDYNEILKRSRDLRRKINKERRENVKITDYYIIVSFYNIKGELVTATEGFKTRNDLLNHYRSSDIPGFAKDENMTVLFGYTTENGDTTFTSRVSHNPKDVVLEAVCVEKDYEPKNVVWHEGE